MLDNLCSAIAIPIGLGGASYALTETLTPKKYLDKLPLRQRQCIYGGITMGSSALLFGMMAHNAWKREQLRQSRMEVFIP